MTYTYPGNSKKSYPPDQKAPLSTELQEFLWNRYPDCFFEAHHELRRTLPMPYGEAIAGLGSGWGFFGVVPRIALGNTKMDCVPYFDALWADIDSNPGVDPHDLLQKTVERLPEGLHPSAVVYSGNKGIHCYWKLDTLMPTDEIETWNKVLAQVAGGDHCHDRTRLLTHPGTPHRTTGKLVQIIDFTAEVHPVGRLDQLPATPKSVPLPVSRSIRATTTGEREEWLVDAEALNCWGEAPEINLSSRLLGIDWGYLSHWHPKGWKRGKQTRSEVEFSIVFRLVGEGVSDRQIKKFADAYFSKHVEESRKYGEHYIDRTIRSARRAWYEKGWLTHPLGGGRKKKDAKYRVAGVADLERYLDLVRGQPVAKWVTEVRDAGKSRASAYRYRDGMEAKGLVEVRDGRIFRS